MLHLRSVQAVLNDNQRFLKPKYNVTSSVSQSEMYREVILSFKTKNHDTFFY